MKITKETQPQEPSKSEAYSKLMKGAKAVANSAEPSMFRKLINFLKAPAGV